jgi:Na+-transporting methylmalonyl-CoA/oxaloacetate decarboxylase gamma subunit
MTWQATITSLQIYGVSIVIAMLVALLIKVMVAVTGRLERAAAADAVPQGEVCPVFLGIPDEDVAALSAAIFAAIGPHHILHISGTGRAWASQGRAAQHTSHAANPRPHH